MLTGNNELYEEDQMSSQGKGLGTAHGQMINLLGVGIFQSHRFQLVPQQILEILEPCPRGDKP